MENMEWNVLNEESSHKEDARVDWEAFRAQKQALPKPKFSIGDEVFVLTNNGIIEGEAIVTGIDVEKFYKMSGEETPKFIEDVSYRIVRKGERDSRNRWISQFQAWKVGKSQNEVIKNIKQRSEVNG